MTREEGIQSSIEKWEKGIRPDLVEQREKEYSSTYWHPCGYCAWIAESDPRGCFDCPLNTYHEGLGMMKICNDDTVYNYAHLTLILADQGKYDEALECCDVVINFMREDLKK